MLPIVPPAQPPEIPAAVPSESPGAIAAIAGHKATTHTIAVILGGVLAVVAPIVSQLWPQATPLIEAAREALPKPPEPRSEPKISAFEQKIRKAWESEAEALNGPKKLEKLGRLIFLYRRAASESVNKWTELGELFKSFHDEADKLDMTSQLPILRGTIAAEWTARIPDKPPGPITELARVRMSDFQREIIAILERVRDPPQ